MGSRFSNRAKAVIKGVVSAVGLKGVNILISLVSVPITISYLGKEEYGVWLTITSILAWLAMADMGVANSLTNRLASAYAEQDWTEARECVSNAFALLLGIVAVVGVIAGCLIVMVNWSSLLRLTDPGLGPKVATAMMVCLAASVANFLYQPVSRIATCFQFGHIQNYWSLLGSLAGLIALLLAAYFKGGLVTLAMTVSGGTIVVLGVSTWWLFRKKLPELRPRFRSDVSRKSVSELLSTGLWFLVLQIGVIVVLQMEPFLISIHLGAAAVGSYSVASRLMALAGLVDGSILVYLWPAYGEAIAKGDVSWIRKALLTNWGASLATTLMIVVPCAIWGGPIIRWWAGPEVVPDRSLLLWLAAVRVMYAFVNPMACFLNAAGKIKPQVWIIVFKAAGVFAVSAWLVPMWGVTGMAATLLIVFVASALPYAWLLGKSFREIASRVASS